MLARDLAHLALWTRLERVRQNVHAQRLPPGIRCHDVGEGFELLSHNGDRRLARLGDRDRVVDRPGGAGASIPETDHRDIHRFGEFL